MDMRVMLIEPWGGGKESKECSPWSTKPLKVKKGTCEGSSEGRCKEAKTGKTGKTGKMRMVGMTDPIRLVRVVCSVTSDLMGGEKAAWIGRKGDGQGFGVLRLALMLGVSNEFDSDNEPALQVGLGALLAFPWKPWITRGHAPSF